MKEPQPGDYFLVPIIAFAILMALSVVDWGTLTGNRITDFSLFEDLRTEAIIVKTNEIIDPELSAALEEVTSDVELPVRQFEESSQTPVKTVEETDVHVSNAGYCPPERVDGVLPIEDFSPDGDGLKNLRNALIESGRMARIAVIGDSYIEGDIFTQDIRRLLQDRFGGNGVGYMSMHSDFPGFRRSVTQNDNGWTVKDIRHNSKGDIKTLSGEYCVGKSEAFATFKGSKIAHADKWTVSRLLFISPAAGVIKLKAGGEERAFDVEASDEIQCLSVETETSELRVSSNIDSLKVLGAWMDGINGVSVDCMSLRGNSGATHRMISESFARKMAEYIDYDLIVVEYGMNAVSSEQVEYSSYSMLMERVIERIRLCYPGADILMLGVGDRGQKIGSDVASLPTIGAMTKAQRDCARKSGVMFWDVREAMGGENSVVDWRDRGMVNADYIHLNHKGGAALAQEFVNSLMMKIDETR